MGLDIKGDPKIFGEGDLSGEKLNQAIQTALINVSNKFRKSLSVTTTLSKFSNQNIVETQKNKSK